MASESDRIITLEAQVRKLMASVMAFQGQPADATLSIPHNDSFPFEDNVDATHPANLRYIISKNVTRVVSARLSIFMAPYRTYNSFSATVTGGQSNTHVHGSAAHNHSWHINAVGYASGALNYDTSGLVGNNGIGAATDIATSTTTPGNTGGASADHTHSLSLAGALGVTEGATAAGVTIAFDGVDATAALGGPFSADVIELDVRRFIQTSIGIKHTIAMQPSGLGRIEAFLRLGCYVSAAQTI